VSGQFPDAQAALMTGNTGAFSPDTPTVAGLLQQAGYRTALIGEWSLGQEPWTQGFVEFMGFRNEAEARNYFAESFWRYVPAAHNGPETVYENSGGKKNGFIPDMFLAAAGNFARVYHPDFANHYQPFFLQLSLSTPESATPGKDDYPVPTDAPFSGESWPQPAKNRAAMVSRLDTDLGQLLQQLQQYGMTNNVAIVLAGAVAPPPFADTNLDFLKLPGEVRGGESADRLRAPLIVYWPGHVDAGTVCQQACSAADFAPTALQIGYARPAANFTGRSLLPLMAARMEIKRAATPASPPHAGTQ
jgi:arylsulfatase A-like enzyme